MAGVVWTEEEIQFLIQNYQTLTPIDIAAAIRRTRKAVWGKMNNMGLMKALAKVNDRFGKLVLLEIFIENNGRQNRTMAKCKCDCGNECIGILTNISNGMKYSCGCLSGCHDMQSKIDNNENFAHGLCHHQLYSTWAGMKTRCTNENTLQYENYGGRGIKICDDWNDFNKFYEWAKNQDYDNKTLDRIDNNGNYCPENCKFSTYVEQASNKSNNTFFTVFGETKTVAQWSRDERCKVTYDVLCYRINKGWDEELAMTKST